MDDRLWVSLLAGVISPLFWLTVMGGSFWLVRRFFPKAEFWLFAPLKSVIGRLGTLRRPRGQQGD